MKNKRTTIKLSYEPEADVLSYELSKKTVIDHAEEVGDLIVHFSKHNVPILVEILEASKFLARSTKMVNSYHPSLLFHAT